MLDSCVWQQNEMINKWSPANAPTIFLVCFSALWFGVVCVGTGLVQPTTQSKSRFPQLYLSYFIYFDSPAWDKFCRNLSEESQSKTLFRATVGTSSTGEFASISAKFLLWSFEFFINFRFENNNSFQNIHTHQTPIDRAENIDGCTMGIIILMSQIGFSVWVWWLDVIYWSAWYWIAWSADIMFVQRFNWKTTIQPKDISSLSNTSGLSIPTGQTKTASWFHLSLVTLFAICHFLLWS